MKRWALAGGLVVGAAAAALAIWGHSNPQATMIVKVAMLSPEAKRCREKVCPDGVAQVGGDWHCAADSGNGAEFKATKQRVFKAECQHECVPSQSTVICMRPGRDKSKVWADDPWEETHDPSAPIYDETRSPDAGDGE